MVLRLGEALSNHRQRIGNLIQLMFTSEISAGLGLEPRKGRFTWVGSLGIPNGWRASTQQVL